MYNIHIGAIRWQIPDFLSDDNSNVSSISHRLRDIRKWKSQNSDLENDQGQGVKERHLRHSTRNVWIGEFFFQNFCYLAIYVYTKGYTHTYMYIHTQSAKQICIILILLPLSKTILITTTTTTTWVLMNNMSYTAHQHK